MTRSRILLLMLLDLVLMGGAGYRAFERYGELKTSLPTAAVAPPPASPVETPAVETSTAPAVPTETTALSTATAEATIPAPSTSTVPVSAASTAPAVALSTAPVHAARVAFRYRNSVAKKAFLTGTFNNWTPTAFRKSASGLWTLVVDIAPGDHAYNFVVDGKTVRDPNQRRSDEKGRSLLRVAPPSK